MISIAGQIQIWLPSAITLIAVGMFLPQVHGFNFRCLSSRFITLPGLMIVSCLLMVLSILSYWVTGRSHPNSIGGLIPWNDAAGYYSCAISLLEGGGGSDFCARRPIYSLYVSALSWLSGANLQITLILQSFVTAGAIALVLRQVLHFWGLGASIIAGATMVAFCGPFSSTILTENIGFVLGSSGLLLLLKGVASRNSLYLFLGAFILSLAMNARAGAFLIFPVICCWPFFSKGCMGAMRAKFSFILVLGVVCGFIPSVGFAHLFGPGSAEFHSNFAHTLYGLAAGGERWTYVLSVIPGATTGQIYGAAFKLIVDTPLLFAAGLFQGFLEYLQRIFSYLEWGPARSLITLFWVWGAASLVFGKKTDISLCLLLLWIGVLASAPILSIDGDTRVFATTISLDAMIVGYGFSLLSKLLVQNRKMWFLVLLLGCIFFSPNIIFYSDPRMWGAVIALGFLLAFASQFLMGFGSREMPEMSVVLGSAPLVFSVFVISLVCIPAIVSSIYAVHPEIEAEAVRCQDGQVGIKAYLGKTSPVLSFVSGSKISLWPLAAEMRSFRAYLSPLVAHYKELEKVPEEYSLSLIIDYSSPGNGSRFVYWDHARYGILQGRQALCLDYETSNLKADISRLANARVIE